MNVSIKRALQAFNRNTKKQAAIGCAVTTAVFALAQVPYVGGLLAAIVAVPLIGYFFRFSAQQIASVEATALPEWNDFSELVINGLRNVFLSLIQILLIIVLPVTCAMVTSLIGTIAGGFAGGLLLGGAVFLISLLAIGIPAAILAQFSSLRFAATNSIAKALNIFSLLHFGLREFVPIFCVLLAWIMLGMFDLATQGIDDTTISLVLSPIIGSIQFGFAVVITSLWAQAYAPFHAYESRKIEDNTQPPVLSE
ncbi:MAG: DUF4013 domain-containing protein [Candidatus Obscuribacterales bacterium]|nr:DUF4013 domain-containing protein [Candidatus Obscuribacterales bacterium]